ncbi:MULTISPECIES: thermonuclease family protein [unclassified Azospirillum]|uniref:thermonuclease family protein n=1 Tax=unclassified Azospirillum TaxID=2630922 RepID=UPI000B64717F|nr:MULTISPECIES: thermonuclease family protein [unclassified Azospirillum]SNR91237.1 Endonuclease YncB, thermonuclease family [Azospirillum sp. RU38E]SNS07161.1 Endonuclease YncB, thermonuclease family [Azospirillum sp. RU37A]
MIARACITLTLFLTLALPVQAAEAPAPVVGKGTAKEGDIVTIDGQDFRLDGIDAPDAGQKCKNVKGTEYDCYELSRRMLERILNNDEVTCTPRKEQGKPPQLAACVVRGVDIGRAMVQLGYALAYRALTPAYAADEAIAASHRRGMWAGRVEAPWEWRSRQQAEKLKQAQ